MLNTVTLFKLIYIECRQVSVAKLKPIKVEDSSEARIGMIPAPIFWIHQFLSGVGLKLISGQNDFGINVTCIKYTLTDS